MPTTPRIEKVTLRAGTKFHSVLTDGTLGPEEVLPGAIEVTLGDLGAVFNSYEDAEGGTLLVRVENEVR